MPHHAPSPGSLRDPHWNPLCVLPQPRLHCAGAIAGLDGTWLQGASPARLRPPVPAAACKCAPDPILPNPACILCLCGTGDAVNATLTSAAKALQVGAAGPGLGSMPGQWRQQQGPLIATSRASRHRQHAAGGSHQARAEACTTQLYAPLPPMVQPPKNVTACGLKNTKTTLIAYGTGQPACPSACLPPTNAQCAGPAFDLPLFGSLGKSPASRKRVLQGNHPATFALHRPAGARSTCQCGADPFLPAPKDPNFAWTLCNCPRKYVVPDTSTYSAWPAPQVASPPQTQWLRCSGNYALCSSANCTIKFVGQASSTIPLAECGCILPTPSNGLGNNSLVSGRR